MKKYYSLIIILLLITILVEIEVLFSLNKQETEMADINPQANSIKSASRLTPVEISGWRFDPTR